MEQQISQSAFAGKSIYVGIDVHAKDFKVSVMTENILFKTFSSPPKADKVFQFLVHNFPGADYYSAYEAGFSGFDLHRKLTKLGVNSIVVNPADIPTTNKERCQKEDKRDSRKLAQGLRAGQLHGVYVPLEKTQHDRSFLRVRESVVKDLTRIKNRIKSMLYFHGIDYPAGFEQKGSHWSKRFISALENIRFEHESGQSSLRVYLDIVKQQRMMLLRINRQIRELSTTPAYKENVSLLISIPGIGVVTAMTLLTELEDLNRFKDFASICSFVGLIPSTHSSGDSPIDTGITSRKNPRLRGILVESAWVAIRYDPALLLAYENLTKRMKGNKAIIRIAKKLLNRIVFVLRNKQMYQKGVIK
jgi:transposase